MDAVNIAAFVGRTKSTTGSIDPLLAQKIHVTLGAEGSAPRAGDRLPPLWHWCAFPPVVPPEDLGQDGHPRLGDFFPPIYLSRRMWAGGALEFLAPLAVGDELICTSTLLAVDEKGRDEPMVFVTVQHEIRGPRGVAVRERQTIVYLDIPPEYAPPMKRRMPDTPLAAERFAVNAATLFRFSAITFNAHRIHYDSDYATDVEHYPSLVIHGPLQAMKLMALAERTRGAPPVWFEFRGVHPMLLGDDIDLAAEEDGDGGLKLYAGQSGHQGTAARAIWEGTL